MDMHLGGIHHITAMAGDAQRNVNFYAHGLGQRLVKTTVNFDDPKTYHLYYGDDGGTPGTILTFFPWPQARPGKRGVGEVATFGYAVDAAAREFWETRLAEFGARQAETEERFGAKVLAFQDPDGMWFELALVDKMPRSTDGAADAQSHPHAAIADAHALGGFYNASLWVEQAQPSVEFLRDILGWHVVGREGQRTRLETRQDKTAWGGFVDVVEATGAGRGLLGPGSIHHVAFRVANAEIQQAWRGHLLQAGVAVTQVKDRQYFRSIYFREPGGVLFEIATDEPGFGVDETVDALGGALQLPSWLEPRRAEIESALPALARAE